jgi:hypothetical protein
LQSLSDVQLTADQGMINLDSFTGGEKTAQILAQGRCMFWQAVGVRWFQVSGNAHQCLIAHPHVNLTSRCVC